ncbi:hypothetical protein CHY_2162 [Carboxydothermus hydrogenoformans Z-2901]|uniref:Uncharacterized protein n=1 Tax=Carboxydothermus hydrogenoformans (strain ATCC BAA-161 / DSM 6008 / Z-2901) TaxID=246194 RepID=Q3AA58_CARHZ|nr:hypothetical protein CHY_2162 [Carboxydothermus hydrogenoformans Z-2901]
MLLGMVLGLLFSALYHIKQDFLFCLTYDKGMERLQEILTYCRVYTKKK